MITENFKARMRDLSIVIGMTVFAFLSGGKEGAIFFTSGVIVAMLIWSMWQVE